MAAIDALVEIFTWVGFALGALLAGVALVIYLIDGTWLPVRAVVEDTEHGRVVRWFDENGDVNEAPLTEAQERDLHGKGMADVFYRRGWRNRMRLTGRSPGARAVALFAAAFLVLGSLALIASWIILFTRG